MYPSLQRGRASRAVPDIDSLRLAWTSHLFVSTRSARIRSLFFLLYIVAPSVGLAARRGGTRLSPLVQKLPQLPMKLRAKYGVSRR